MRWARGKVLYVVARNRRGVEWSVMRYPDIVKAQTWADDLTRHTGNLHKIFKVTERAHLTTVVEMCSVEVIS